MEAKNESRSLAEAALANISALPPDDNAIANLSAKIPDSGEPLRRFNEDRTAATTRAALLEHLSNHFEQDPKSAEDLWTENEWPFPFPLVLRKEMEAINQRRIQEEISAASVSGEGLGAYAWARQMQLLGLAFSGGGIRSATFALGILQALADCKILRLFDYLSTVSGGGYIGAWFAGWLKRGACSPGNILQPFTSFNRFQDLLSPSLARDPQAIDQKPIRFLRSYSNYLTPRLGIFSFDTWTLPTIYIRNLILNLAILVAGFGALLLFPRLVAWPFFHLNRPTTWTMPWLIALALLLLFIAVVFISRNLNAAMSKRAGRHRGATTIWVQGFGLLPLLVSVALASAWFWINSNVADTQGISLHLFWFAAAAFFCVLSLALSVFGGVVQCFENRRKHRGFRWAAGLIALVAIVCGIVGALLLRGYLAIMDVFSANEMNGGLWHSLVLGPPLLLTVIVITAILHIGLIGIDLPDASREWLSRFRAIAGIYTFFWLALFGAAIYGPLVLAWLGAKSQSWIGGLSFTWIFTTVAGLMAGNSSKTGKTKENQPSNNYLDLLARIGPPVFLVGFILNISMGEHFLLAHDLLTGGSSFESLTNRHWDLLFGAPYLLGSDWPVGSILILLAIFSIATVLLAWRVDINEFSMHHFYKNRLVRCYLGASNNNRKPNPFTGFDPGDDFHLSSLVPDQYRGPYHIINTTLNLSADKDLAWQERKSASFILSPYFCGFDYSLERESSPGTPPNKDRELKSAAYRETSKYAYHKGMRLGTAMAISGAAANPNQGFNTSLFVAFLLTVFNIRLGWWIGNPRRDIASQYASPRFGLLALISELLGRTDDTTRFISLSDGGHFDNTGIYELVRRRCKYIVLSDAEQDGSYGFGSLGMVIRRCRIDFGAEIEIDLTKIVPDRETRRSQSHCAVGFIHYVDGSQGTLVYIKCSLTGDEPEDVLVYAKAQPEFPHETTADQWFGESQFESYRKLGYHAGMSTFADGQLWQPSTQS